MTQSHADSGAFLHPSHHDNVGLHITCFQRARGEESEEKRCKKKRTGQKESARERESESVRDGEREKEHVKERKRARANERRHARINAVTLPASAPLVLWRGMAWATHHDTEGTNGRGKRKG
jgi:uncharacterized protein YdaU (DUF1376 family)